jgi:predicted dehydrogenase
MVSVGVIGLGMIGLQHSAVIKALDNQALTAICDKESFLTKMAKKVVPEINFYSDYAEMLAGEDLDAVIVCTPIQTHEKVVLDLINLNTDLSLFVEKPLAGDYPSAQNMVNAAKNLRGVTMVGFQKRFTSVFRKTKELLDQGAIGDLLFTRSYFYCGDVLKHMEGWKYAQGTGGVTVDLSPHLLDLLIWYFGEPSRAETNRVSFFSDAEDLAHVDVKYSSGLTGYIDIGWSMRNFNPFEMMIEVHGTNGTINVTDDRLAVYLDRDVSEEMKKGSHLIPFSSIESEVPFLLTAAEYVREDDYFMKCVMSRRQPDSSFESAAKVNRFISMIQGSA